MILYQNRTIVHVVLCLACYQSGARSAIRGEMIERLWLQSSECATLAISFLLWLACFLATCARSVHKAFANTVLSQGRHSDFVSCRLTCDTPLDRKYTSARIQRTTPHLLNSSRDVVYEISRTENCKNLKTTLVTYILPMNY